MPTKSELTHYRLQAMLREHSFSDLEYLGDFPGQGHTYRIGSAEVYADQITELESEESDESDSV